MVWKCSRPFLRGTDNLQSISATLRKVVRFMRLQLSADYPCLVVFNRFWGQCTLRVTSMLKRSHIYIVTVPANCTYRLPCLDISVKNAVKAFLRSQFQDWYAKCMCQQMTLCSDEEQPLSNQLHWCVSYLVPRMRCKHTYDAIFSSPGS